MDVKEGNKVILVHDGSQKETEAGVRRKWSSDLPQQSKMGRKPSSEAGPGQRTAFPDSKQQTEMLLTARAWHVPETGREVARVPCPVPAASLGHSPTPNVLSPASGYFHALAGETRSHQTGLLVGCSQHSAGHGGHITIAVVSFMLCKFTSASFFF